LPGSENGFIFALFEGLKEQIQFYKSVCKQLKKKIHVSSVFNFYG